MNNNNKKKKKKKKKEEKKKKKKKHLGILEADTIKQVQMKDTIRKEYLRRTRKLIETKHSSRIPIKGINT